MEIKIIPRIFAPELIRSSINDYGKDAKYIRRIIRVAEGKAYEIVHRATLQRASAQVQLVRNIEDVIGLHHTPLYDKDTPTVFVNGSKLPEDYKIEYLHYFTDLDI